MEIERLKWWIGAQAELSEAVERKVSGEGEKAEICRQIEAHLASLIPQPMATAPRDGSRIMLITRSGFISATYDKGRGWTDTMDDREYWGPQWVCYDDAVTIEIEETPDGQSSPEALAWLPLPEAWLALQGRMK